MLLKACFVLLSILVASCHNQLIGKEDFPADWDIPSDMLNFRYSPKQAPEKSDVELKNVVEEPETHKQQESIEEEDVSMPAENLDLVHHEIRTSLGGSEGDQDVMILSRSCKNPILKRFISVLSRRLGAAGKAIDVQRYVMLLKINANKRLLLQEYGQNCDHNVDEILKILEEMVENVQPEYKISIKMKFEDLVGMHFQDFLKLAFAAIIMVGMLTLEVIGRVSWISQLKRLFVLAILVSFAMTYYHEIQIAEADFQAKSKNLPVECMKDLEEMSYFSGLTRIYNDWFSTKSANDRCKEYHETFLIHPKFKVTPTKVIAVTITRFVVEPLEHMGIAFGKAFKNIFSELPVTLWIPGFAFIIILVLGFLLVVTVIFGYNFSINLPFWAGMNIAPPQRAILHNSENEGLQEEVVQLRLRIEDLQNRPQQQALPPPVYQDYRRHCETLPLNPPGYDSNSNSNSETLPYPDIEPDHLESGDAPRNQHFQSNTGLRRRHTCSAAIRSDSEVHTLPYPVEEETPPMESVPRSISDPQRMREGIGFEPLVRGLTEAQKIVTPDELTTQHQRTRETNVPDISAHETVKLNHKNPLRTANEMEEKVHSDLNNVSTYLMSDNGNFDQNRFTDKDWVEVESVGAQEDNTDSVPSPSGLSLDQLTKEAEAGFILDSLK